MLFLLVISLSLSENALMQGQIKKDYHCGILSWFSFLFPELNIDVFLSVMPFVFFIFLMLPRVSFFVRDSDFVCSVELFIVARPLVVQWSVSNSNSLPRYRPITLMIIW